MNYDRYFVCRATNFGSYRMYLNIMHATEMFPDIEIPDDELIFFNNNALHSHLVTGDHFITRGTICNKIAFIETGQLQSVITEEDDTRIVARYLKNQFVSSFNSFFNHEKSNWDIQAVEPTVLVVISDQLFIQLFQRHVCWSLFWIRVLESKSLDLLEQEKTLLSREGLINKYIAPD